MARMEMDSTFKTFIGSTFPVVLQKIARTNYGLLPTQEIT